MRVRRFSRKLCAFVPLCLCSCVALAEWNGYPYVGNEDAVTWPQMQENYQPFAQIAYSLREKTIAITTDQYAFLNDVQTWSTYHGTYQGYWTNNLGGTSVFVEAETRWVGTNLVTNGWYDLVTPFSMAIGGGVEAPTTFYSITTTNHFTNFSYLMLGTDPAMGHTYLRHSSLVSIDDAMFAMTTYFVDTNQLSTNMADFPCLTPGAAFTNAGLTNGFTSPAEDTWYMTASYIDERIAYLNQLQVTARDAGWEDPLQNVDYWPDAAFSFGNSDYDVYGWGWDVWEDFWDAYMSTNSRLPNSGSYSNIVYGPATPYDANVVTAYDPPSTHPGVPSYWWDWDTGGYYAEQSDWHGSFIESPYSLLEATNVLAIYWGISEQRWNNIAKYYFAVTDLPVPVCLVEFYGVEKETAPSNVTFYPLSLYESVGPSSNSTVKSDDRYWPVGVSSWASNLWVGPFFSPGTNYGGPPGDWSYEDIYSESYETNPSPPPDIITNYTYQYTIDTFTDWESYYEEGYFYSGPLKRELVGKALIYWEFDKR